MKFISVLSNFSEFKLLALLFPDERVSSLKDMVHVMVPRPRFHATVNKKMELGSFSCKC